MSHFDAASLRFLSSLARHNDRDWFAANRGTYEEHVRGPMAEFVEEMDIRLSRFAPELTGDPKRSVFRIHRDTRFSKDKSPYKTNAGCWFFHEAGSSKVGRDAHGGGAGLYFHLQPGHCFAAGGCWMPPRPALLRFRAALVDDQRGFEKIVRAPAFRRRFGALSDEGALKGVPRGYDAGHPAAGWLRLTSFTVSRPLTDAQVTGPRLAATVASDFEAMVPLVRWLNDALGLRALRSR